MYKKLPMMIVSKKQTKLSRSQSSSPIPSLPDDVILTCLARLSGSDLAALYRVSKRLRSLVVSPELYKIRSLLGYREECLYVCITTGYQLTPRWLILGRGKSENRIVRSHIPCIPCLQPTEKSSVVALDSGIYVIGGLLKGVPTSNVLFLDCRTHTWRKVPSMRMPRVSAAAGVVDGKIYVFGGGHNSPLTYGEVFNPKTQTWDTLTPLPDRYNGNSFIRESFVMDDKVYAVCGSQTMLYYSPYEGEWGRPKIRDLSRFGIKSHCCAANSMLYGWDIFGNLYWCEFKSDKVEWKKVMGLAFLRKIIPKPVTNKRSSVCEDLFKCCSKLRKFGMNIALIWFKYKDADKGMNKVEIWCAEISFERRQEENEIWGKIEWLETVASLDHHPSSHLEVLNSATVNL